jgi:hypothetical protein
MIATVRVELTRGDVGVGVDVSWYVRGESS